MTDLTRIGIITTSFPNYHGDVAGSFVFGLARSLARRGHAVEVVAPEPAGPADWGRNALWLEQVRVTAAPYARPRTLERLFYGAGVPDNLSRRPWIAMLVPPAVAGLLLRAATRSGSWDALISHWLVPSAIIGGLTRTRRARHLAMAHSADVHLLKRMVGGKLLARAAVHSCDHLGFVSSGLRREFISLLGPGAAEMARSRSSVIQMGIEVSEMVSDRPREEVRLELGLSGFVVLFLGRLVPIKGADLLIDALRGLDRFQLVVAGDGPERDFLERKAAKLGVRAHFLGAVKPARRAELLAACDAVAVPSRITPGGRREGSPLVVAEAMAAARPVVAADTGSLGEVLDQEVTGLLVPNEDAEALGEAFVKLRGDKELRDRLSRAGQALAMKRDWNRLVPAYESILVGADAEIGRGRRGRSLTCATTNL